MTAIPFNLRALVLAALSAGVGLAQAATTADQVSNKRTDDNISVSDNNANGNAANSNGNSGTSSATFGAVNKFNADTGVLTGVNATMSTTRGTFTQSRTGNAVGDTSLNASWSLGGTTVNGTPASFANTTTGSTSSFANLTLSPVTLSSFLYDGSGATTLTGTVGYTVTANKDSGDPSRSITAAYSRPGDDQSNTRQTVSYDYLQHANASFNGASDQNTLSVAAGSSFNIYALANTLGAADTTKLDAVSFSCVSGLAACGAFSLNLGLFQDLAAGNSVAGSIGLLALTPGAYAAEYLLTFTDDTAVGVGQRTNTLVLDVTGSVSAVPEADSYAMMLAGLGAMVFLARRRQKA